MNIKTYKYNEKRFCPLGFVLFGMLQARKQEYGTHHRRPNSQGIVDLAMRSAEETFHRKRQGMKKETPCWGKRPCRDKKSIENLGGLGPHEWV